VKESIRDAFYHGVTVFAAASNSGATPNHPVSFPASMRQVICINSTDGFGNPSAWNPSPTRDRNFSIIGEGIEAAWPTQLGATNAKVASGTSVATPIAAGIAALILQYARQHGPKAMRVRNPERLRDCDEMRKVFQFMTQPRNDYLCLIPAKIFEVRGDHKHIVISSKISDLLDEF
jgi:subtilisin family serine protease